MAIWGGAIGGYWETGSWKIASAPASMMTIAMTHAKMGRSMKKRAMGMSSALSRSAARAGGGAGGGPGGPGRRGGRRRERDRADLGAGLRPLQPFHDDPVAGRQP